MSLDHQRRANAGRAAHLADREYEKQCARVKTNPHNVEQALADIAESEIGERINV